MQVGKHSETVRKVCDLLASAPLTELGALGLLIASLLLMGLRLTPGPFILILSLGILAAISRRVFLVAVAFSVPTSTIGWDMSIAEIGGRTFDARLLITFGLALLLAGILIVERPRPTRTELIAGALVAWIVIVGLLASDSILTWGPPAARWFSYAAILIIARRWTSTPSQLATLFTAVAAGFTIPAGLGLFQFVIGDASFINGAARATAPGGRGPIGLAFAGQMVAVIAASRAGLQARHRAAWLVEIAVGVLAVVASATRIATVTVWLAVSALATSRRRWWMLLAGTAVLAVALAARPELLSRYFGTISPGNGPAASPGATAAPSPEPRDGGVVLDSSLQFRVFVWRTVLREWTHDPVLGIGPGMTAKAVSEVSPAARTAPHNDYIGMLAETGLPGLALFVGLQGSVLVCLWRLRRIASDSARGLVDASAILFVAVNVLGALNNPTYFYDVQIALWAFVGGCVGAFGVSART